MNGKNTIDFIDIGCSKGSSYKYKFENGLAIDIDIRKVNECLTNMSPQLD